jgi:hypothetical protein
MKPINLTKKIVGEGTLRLSDDGVHVTNGHWLCRRELLKQAEQLASLATTEALYPKAVVKVVRAKDVERVIPDFGVPTDFERTNWSQRTGYTEAVLFVGGKDRKSQIWLDRVYVEMFDLRIVVSEECSEDVSMSPAVVRDKEGVWQVAVMPMRLKYQEGLI